MAQLGIVGFIKGHTLDKFKSMKPQNDLSVGTPKSYNSLPS